MPYTPTIGLEIHAGLKTQTKMFCDSKNDPEEKRPNHNVCPVCLGHPGALPTINKEAVEHVIRVGLAIGGTVAPVTKFDRKNYFYPDLPKGYQISQYDSPLVTGGELLGVKITRVHLEEDTGTLIHTPTGDSLVDFNRSGIPLMELVTEPDIRSAEEAVKFAKELRLILRYLGVSNANMENGEMRVEVNISMDMGTKVEVKNLNSFKAVEGAIAYEIQRQSDALDKGEKIVQETRGWDENKKVTVSQRWKEEAQDYRYFPEPDLPPFSTDVFSPEVLGKMLPELPAMKRERFLKEFGIPQAQIDLLVEEPAFANFFEEAASELATETAKEGYSLLANYLLSDLKGLVNEKGVMLSEMKVTPENFADLIALLLEKKIMSRQAKDILVLMCETGDDPRVVVERENLGTIGDTGVIEDAVREILAVQKQAVEDYKAGKTSALTFLIGQAMGRLKGKADPDTLRTIIARELAEKD